MKDWLIKIGIVVVVILFIWMYLSIANFNPPNREQILLEKITELETKIDSLNIQKNNLKTVVDSTHIKIITNEKHYQERVNTIITQPLSIDSQYVSDYIGRYIESHSSYFQ